MNQLGKLHSLASVHPLWCSEQFSSSAHLWCKPEAELSITSHTITFYRTHFWWEGGGLLYKRDTAINSPTLTGLGHVNVSYYLFKTFKHQILH